MTTAMTMNTPVPNRQRGIAMALVLISVALATILAMSYFASRDNSAHIGRNVPDASAARSAALGGLQAAVAMMETQTAWRDTAENNQGRILQDAHLGSGSVTVTLTDLLNGQVPEAESTTYFLIESEGQDLDGITKQYATATAYAPLYLDPANSAAVDLAEFAIAATQDITLSGAARIDRWHTSPLAMQGRRINLGIRATGASSVVIGSGALVVDATIYHDDDADDQLVSYSNDDNLPAPLQSAIPHLPVPHAPPPKVSRPDTSDDLTVTSATTINANVEYDDIIVETNATLTLRGSIRIAIEDDVTLNQDARIVIDGDVELAVFRDLTLLGGAAIVRRNGSLQLHVGDDFEATGAYIGDEATAATVASAGNHPYDDPFLIQVAEIDGYAVDTRNWTFDGDSLFKASLYGRDAEVLIAQNAVLYGRIVGRDVALTGNAGVFYDHSLDERCGYSTAGSGIFDGTSIHPEISSLSSLAPTDLAALANTLEMAIFGNGEVYEGPPPPPNTPSVPTPRPGSVEYTLHSLGPPSLWYVHPLEAP